MRKPIRTIAVIGTGVIGASWTALFLAKGLKVVATDIADNAEASLNSFVDAAWPMLERLGLAPVASRSRLTFAPSPEEAVAGADFADASIMPRATTGNTMATFVVIGERAAELMRQTHRI
jgi:3-hydroxyacyl-CoA dehydrogenase